MLSFPSKKNLPCMRNVFKKNTQTNYGELAEWSKAHDWKSCERAIAPRVQIPYSPPSYNAPVFYGVHYNRYLGL